MHTKATNLNTVLAANILHARSLADDLHQSLACVSLLVQVADISARHGLLQGQADGVVDTLEPDGNVGDECNFNAKLAADLTLVDVICQAVGDDVASQILDIVLGAGLGACAGVTGNTKDGGLAAEEGYERCNTELCGGCVTPWVGNTGGFGNVGSIDKLWKTVGPLAIESVVCGEVDDDAVLRSLAFIDSINEWLADAVGKCHDPAVDFSCFLHTANIFSREVLVGDISLFIALEFLASKLAGRDVSKIHVWVCIEETDESLSSVSSSTNQGDLGWSCVRRVLGTERRVWVGCSSIST